MGEQPRVAVQPHRLLQQALRGDVPFGGDGRPLGARWEPSEGSHPIAWAPGNATPQARHPPSPQEQPVRRIPRLLSVLVSHFIEKRLEFAALEVALQPRHPERASGLCDRPGLLEDILDRRADLVGGDTLDSVDALPHDPERLRPDLIHRHAVGEDPDVLQNHPLPRRERRVQGGGVVRLDPDDARLRARGLDAGGDAGDEAAAADLDEDRVERLALLAHDLHPHRALARDNVLVVERRDDDHPLSRISCDCPSEQASMRPRHKAAEYDCLDGRSPHPRPRPGPASMRPRHKAAEYAVRHGVVLAIEASRASMRPRHKAAEYMTT